MTCNVSLPSEGGFFYRGPRPTGIEVDEVPAGITSDDVEVIVRGLCGTREGLMVGEPSRGAYMINYRVLLKLARQRGVAVPVGYAAPRLQEGRFFNMNGQTDSHGILLGSTMPAPVRRTIRLDGRVSELV